jgi:hypothetical protein
VIRIWRAYNVVEATHLRNVLESAGIHAFLRNENLIRIAGEVPFDQTWPEVWIFDDAQAAAALELVQKVQRPRHGQAAWTCGTCGEWLDGQFTACWNCGSDKP